MSTLTTDLDDLLTEFADYVYYGERLGFDLFLDQEIAALLRRLFPVFARVVQLEESAHVDT